MPGKALTADERRSLLHAVAACPVDADSEDAEAIVRTFLSGPQYRWALDRSVLVVRGERGAGKTALFQLLQAAQQLRIPVSEIIEGAPRGHRIDGYSEHGTIHPPAPVLQHFAEAASPEEIRALWLGHLTGRIHAEHLGKERLPGAFATAYAATPAEPSRWVPAALATTPALYSWLDGVERAATETVFVVYDQLDRVGTTNRVVREKVAAGLLDLWLSLSQRYAQISGKVLLREDIFQAALTSFSDATKLEARSVLLNWNRGRLYALLARRLAYDENLRDWLQSVSHLSLSRHRRLGWIPEPEFDDREQNQFATALVGPYMGKGPSKGFSYTWLINHLQDAHLRVSPRSLLSLIRGAADLALQRGPKAAYRRLLTPSELQQSLEKASLRRVTELKEDFPVVARLEGLREFNLFLQKRVVINALATVRIDDGFQDSPEAAFDELVRIGALSNRGDGRIDVPDVYRYGFGIKRKGGTRRVV